MNKINLKLFYCLLIFLGLFSHNIYSQSVYYDCLQKDNLYLFISNNGIEVYNYSYSGSPFTLVKKITRNINAYLWSINNKYLLLKTNDSLFLYDLILPDFKLLYKTNDTFNLKNVYAWGNDFMVKSSNKFGVFKYSGNSFSKITDSTMDILTTSDIFQFPYIIRNRRDFYRYNELIGLYNSYYLSSTTDPGMNTIVPKSRDEVLYTIYVMRPYLPPAYAHTRVRKLISPNFPLVFNFYYFGLSIYPSIGNPIVATNKYIYFRNSTSGLSSILNYSESIILQYSYNQMHIRITDHVVIKLDSNIYYSNSIPANFIRINPVVNLEENLQAQPIAFQLSQNFPNPFNPSTKIKFTIPPLTPSLSRGEMVILRVYDILGREVATLVNEELSAGEYEVEFTAGSASTFRQAQAGAGSASTSSAFATAFNSGIYFYQLRVGNFVETRKMILIR